MAAYVTIQYAQEYFDNRLHETAWSQSNPLDRPKALLAATRIIDNLSFKCDKTESDQENEFPRGTDTSVPEAIEWATCEIAYSLLDGVDPDLELENLSVVSQGVGSVRSTYSRTQEPQEHIINGVPSATAWRYLKPFLRDDDAIRISRVS